MNELFKNQNTEIRIVEDFLTIRHKRKDGETIGLNISIEDLINKLPEILLKTENDKKQKSLVFDVQSTAFTVPNEHGIVKLKLPFGWEKIKHFKAGMKVKVKLIKK